MAVQGALGETWLLYDMGLLVAMIICLITYAVYVQIMADFQPQYSYEVYDSLGAAQARLLLPKKVDPASDTCESLHSCPHNVYMLTGYQRLLKSMSCLLACPIEMMHHMAHDD